MYVRRRIRWSLTWQFAWRNLLFFTVWGALVTGAYVLAIRHDVNIGLPFLPVSTIGIAVAFYVGFKNSQSYDRLWEARKIWGAIVNASRTWATQVIGFVTGEELELAASRTRLIHRHLAWVNALRLQLRRTTIFDRENLSYTPDLKLARDVDCDGTIPQFVTDAEYDAVLAASNQAAQLLRIQSEDIAALRKAGAIDAFQHVALMETVKGLFDQQGACERIKNTPFPRQYAYFSSLFVKMFTVLLPFGLVAQFADRYEAHVWLTIPFSVLISWVFSTMEIVGDNSEDPFENYVNDVPMSALSRTIEIDLREMLHEREIPPRLTPVDDILM